MKRIRARGNTVRKLVTAAAAAAVLVFAAAANAANTTSNSLSYEFDNGTTWTLQQNTAALGTTYTAPGYSDVGIVVDLGPLSSLTSINVTGTGVQDNIWVSDGTSGANTPGTHSLSDPVDFAYGFDQGGGTSFWMSADPGGSSAGQVATLAQLQREHPTGEAYAWIGVVYSGQSVSGSVSAVNGHSVGNRTMSIANNGDGTVTTAIR